MTVADPISDPAPAARSARKRKGRFLQRAEYVLYRSASALARAASVRQTASFGSFLGRISQRVLRRRSELVLRNLRMIFPEKDASEVTAIADACWRHFGRAAVEYLRLPQMSFETIAARCEIINGEILDAAVAENRGVILISAHVGNWEYGGLVIMSLADRVRTVARTLDNEFLERDLGRLRAQTGAAVIDRRRAARQLLQTLNEKGVVVLLPDQAVLPREGILVRFLGRPAWTTPAPAKLALRVGSPIVFAFCIPHGAGYRLEFEGPVLIDQLPAHENTPEGLTQRINDVISKRILERPELWLWMHDRWKATGEGGRADEE
jgi:Kdo2-lipid IVA lauroyltransferase/acyltransferase